MSIKGFYLLGLFVKTRIALRIKTLKAGYYPELERGYYVYIGSAFGPGGLHGRITRHLRSRKKLRWHIDYLTTKRTKVIPIFVYAILNSRDSFSECKIVKLLLKTKFFRESIFGFGATDSQCPTHLLKIEGRLTESLKVLKKILSGGLFLKFYTDL